MNDQQFSFNKSAAYAVTPIDGRYAGKTEPLSPYFSEAALLKYRTMVEGEFLIYLIESGAVSARSMTEEEVATVRALYNFQESSVAWIKEKEATTNHDVKAVEYFIKDELAKSSLKDLLEWVHFGLTSEDTNNLSYALMLSDGIEKVMIPEIKKIISELTALSETYADVPMLARTHGQSASPTTFGKEMKVFVARLEKQLEGLKSIKIQAKINGATGNYNALVAAYPNTDWITFSEKFIESFNANRAQKLEANLFTTQIECHDSYVAIFDTLRRINMILLDFSQDMWRYISDGYVGQKTKATEVGSSTMPHKVNPIDFENAEGNFGIANALFNHFAMKLPVSRLQRDLSDSTVERAFGTAFAHTLIAYQSLQKGLSKISVNSERMQEDLTAHPEVLAEAIQTVLRREGVETPYEKLKELTRGKTVTMDDFAKFIDSLEVSAELKKELHAFTPENYIGLATILAKKKS
jgi:adenylosuccinate lyase